MLLVLITGLQATGKSTMAEVAANELGCAVLGHDWAMSGLRPYPQVQAALDAMDPPGHRDVGWSILWALARAQLRMGTSVVLDGVAREPEATRCRHLADDEGAGAMVVMTSCPNVELHQARIVGRARQIPNWYELDWEHVSRARSSWTPPTDVDLVLDAAHSLVDNTTELRELIRDSV
jgi:predicted kinase